MDMSKIALMLTNLKIKGFFEEILRVSGIYAEPKMSNIILPVPLLTTYNLNKQLAQVNYSGPKIFSPKFWEFQN